MEWSKNLEIGHVVVDKQHKELFRKIDDVVKAGVKSRKEPESFGVALNLLMEYCLLHFSEEENIQLKSNYPDYLMHKAQHTKFLKVLKSFETEFKNNGPSIELANRVEQVAVDWLVIHIAQIDQTLANHIASSKSAR